MKKTLIASLFAMMCAPTFAGEASLVVPNIKDISLDSYNLLMIGLVVSIVGVIFGLVEFFKVKRVEVHAAMAEVGNTIFETCKTYLIQQGKFLLALEVLICENIPPKIVKHIPTAKPIFINLFFTFFFIFYLFLIIYNTLFW